MPSGWGEVWGGVFSLQPTKGSGKASWAPPVGSGAEPRPKTDFGIFWMLQNANFCTYNKILGGGGQFALPSPAPNSGGTCPLVPPWSTPIVRGDIRRNPGRAKIALCEDHRTSNYQQYQRLRWKPATRPDHDQDEKSRFGYYHCKQTSTYYPHLPYAVGHDFDHDNDTAMDELDYTVYRDQLVG